MNTQVNHFPLVKMWQFTPSTYACVRSQSRQVYSWMWLSLWWLSPFPPAKQWIIQPKPEGYGQADFSAKSGYCNGINVNGIPAQGNSAERFLLALKETITYCGKCICLCCKTTPDIYFTYWKSFRIVNWVTSIQEWAGLFVVCTVILYLFRFSARQFQIECVHLRIAKSCDKQFITRKVV